MTTSKANKIYDLLVRMGGANKEDKDVFVYNHCKASYPCSEWRFQGRFGFGGKYRAKSNTVTMYSEDETPELLALIKKINKELENISEDLS